jgi:hypothetical protein
MNGIVRGAGATFSGTGSLSLGPGGPQANGGAYVDLPNGLISSLNDATFETWFTINTATGWARVMDFGDMNATGGPAEVTDALPLPAGAGGAGDTVFVSANTGGTNYNTQRFSIENEFTTPSGPGCPSDCGGVTVTNTFDGNGTFVYGQNTQAHVILTVDDDIDDAGPSTQARYTLFINGGQVGTTLSNNRLRHMHDVNNWLGRSNYSADQSLSGTFNEFRIYDHAFTASDVGLDSLLGPDRTGEILTLEVNTSTGAIKILNEQGDLAIPYDYYNITSASGALNEAGWNSLDDQDPGADPVGTAWDESIGGSNDNQLSEFYLGTTGDTFAMGGERTLGNAFDVGGMQDLTFEYGGPSGYLIQGSVTYVMGGNLGDYNGDNVVNAADYTVYRNCKSGVGGCTALPDGTDDTPGSVAFDDYTRWKTLYGTSYGAGASVGGSNVPEPATLVSLVFGLLVAGISAGRRRK